MLGNFRLYSGDSSRPFSSGILLVHLRNIPSSLSRAEMKILNGWQCELRPLDLTRLDSARLESQHQGGELAGPGGLPVVHDGQIAKLILERGKKSSANFTLSRGENIRFLGHKIILKDVVFLPNTRPLAMVSYKILYPALSRIVHKRKR